MISQLPSSVRRPLALAILTGLLAAAYFGVVDSLLNRYLRAGQEIEENLALLERYRSLAATSESLKTRFESLERRERENQIYLSAADANLAGAELQTLLNRLAKNSGAELRSIQVVPSQMEGKVRRIGISVQMTVTGEALIRFLHAVETGPTLLFLDNVYISSRAPRRPKDAEEAAKLILTIRAMVHGYLRSDLGDEVGDEEA